MQLVTDYKQIASLCKLASLAYQGPEIATPKLQKEFPGGRIQFVSGGFLIAKEKESQMIIVLKGISNLEELSAKRRIFEDKAFVYLPCGIDTPPGRTHRGLTDVARALFQNLRGYVYSHEPVVILGHSLGGGVGLLLGALFAAEICKFHTVQVYAFGSPKVGDRPFISWLEQNVECCSINVEGDPIPFWPVVPEYALTTRAHTLKGLDGARQFIKVPNVVEGISAAEIQAHCIFSYLWATNQAAKRSG